MKWLKNLWNRTKDLTQPGWRARVMATEVIQQLNSKPRRGRSVAEEMKLAGLPKSWFTSKRTKAREEEYRKVLLRMDERDAALARKCYGEPRR